MIITIIIIVIITSGGGGGGEVAREALKVYKTDIMQLTGVLSPVQFMSTSTLAVERLVLAGRILPSFYVGNSILLACASAMNKASFQVIVELRGVFMWQNSSPSYRDLCRLYL